MLQKLNIIDSPFVYGRIATDASFTDREEETASLVRDFRNLTNTVLLSPRRWGKSSLVRRAALIASEEDSSLKICHVDIFNVRTEEEFYQKLAAEVLRNTSSRLEDMLASAKGFISSIVPVITVAGDNVNKVNISFQAKEIGRSADEILDLAEKIATEKRIKISSA